MRTQTTNRRGGLLLAGVASLALLGGSAFTASNTGINAHTAGTSSVGVTGLTVEQVTYNLTSDKQTVTSLTFTSTATKTTMKGSLSLDGGTTWTACNAIVTDADPLICTAPASTALADVNNVDLVVNTENVTVSNA